MATINTAEHFRVARDYGQIAPGRVADVLLVNDIQNFQAGLVIAKGKVIAKEGELLIDLPSYEYPEWVVQSVHLGKHLNADDFRIFVEDPKSHDVTANIIGVIENQAPTKHLRERMSPVNGEILIDLGRDIIKVALVERHKGTNAVFVGLVHGFGFTERCAVATTVAHDSHQMIVIGTDEAMMAQAANTLEDFDGGQVVVKNGEIIGQVELPIGGLMANERAEIVAEKAASVLNGFRACGCTLNNPNMQLSLLALVVIPELSTSDLGLVDVTKFDFIPVIENNG